MQTKRMFSRFLIAIFLIWLSVGPPLAIAEAGAAGQAGVQQPDALAWICRPQTDDTIEDVDAVLAQIESEGVQHHLG